MVLAEAPTVYELVGVVTPTAARSHLERRTHQQMKLTEPWKKNDALINRA
jgi:hypothetical protein